MRIFLSYRRSDSQDATARLADRLSALPRIKSVFLDVESISAGEAFPDRLRSALTEADICLVLIGTGWLGQSESDEISRIKADGDFVRMEVAEALRLNKRVIPVLLNDAPMPGREELPEDLHALLDRNALFLRHMSFHQDVEILSDAILHGDTGGRLGKRRRMTPLDIAARIAGALILSVIMLLVIGLFSFWISGGRSLESLLGGRAGLGLLVIAVIGFCQAVIFRKIRLPFDRS